VRPGGALFPGLCEVCNDQTVWRECRAGVGTRLTRPSDDKTIANFAAVVCQQIWFQLQFTCRKGYLSEMELRRFRNLTLNPTLTLTLALTYSPMPIRFGLNDFGKIITLRTSELSPLV